MKTILCNIHKPDLYKIASVTYNKLNDLHTFKGKTYIKLNGEKMLTSKARKEMLKGVELVGLDTNPCEV